MLRGVPSRSSPMAGRTPDERARKQVAISVPAARVTAQEVRFQQRSSIRQSCCTETRQEGNTAVGIIDEDNAVETGIIGSTARRDPGEYRSWTLAKMVTSVRAASAALVRK